jgi:surface antigen
VRRFWICVALTLVSGPVAAEVWWIEGARPQTTIPAAIIGPTDNREWLTPESGEKLGLSAAEVSRIQDSTGFVACRGALGSGALVIDNQHILTATHVVVDRKDPKKKFRQDCAFFTHDVRKRYVAHRLVLTENSYLAGTLDVDRDRSGDWAVIKLARPVARGVPFAIGDERVWRIGNPIVMISALMSDRPDPVHKDNPGLPLAQKCTIRHLTRGVSARIFLSDCDSKSGASGGVSVMRVDGNLVLAGITVGNAGTVDFKPYGPNNFTASISVTEAVVSAVFQLGARDIRPSTHTKNTLLAGDIGDDLDEATRLIALRTEMRALNHFTSSAAVRWKTQSVSGFIIPLPHIGASRAADRCRTFVHAIIYGPDRAKSAKGKACRRTDGSWAVAADLTTEVRSPLLGAGAPPCASAGQQTRETPSSQCR